VRVKVVRVRVRVRGEGRHVWAEGERATAAHYLLRTRRGTNWNCCEAGD
jgi:hypothetical protein